MTAPSLAPPAPLHRPRVLLVGTTFATAAVVMAFAGMLGFYLLERAAVVSAGNDWLPEGAVIPLTQPNVMMMGLVMSVVTMQWVVQAVRNDDRPNTYLALALTLILGIAYINMGFYLFSLMGLDLGASDSAAPLLIHVLGGGHMILMVVAMLFLALMAFRALAGQYTSRQYDGLAAAAVFWHASVAIYAVIWLAVYVTK